MKHVAKIVALQLIVIGVMQVWPHLTHVDSKGIAMLCGAVVFALAWVFVDACFFDRVYVEEHGMDTSYNNMLCQMSCGQYLHITTTKKMRGGKK